MRSVPYTTSISPLISAVKGGDPTQVKKLLTAKADPSIHYRTERNDSFTTDHLAAIEYDSLGRRELHSPKPILISAISTAAGSRTEHADTIVRMLTEVGACKTAVDGRYY